RALPLVGRALAHVVDGAGGVADAGEQAVGAADHFHLFVTEAVGGAGGDTTVVGQAGAVGLRIEDVEAACAIGGAVGFPFVDLHAGGQAQGLVDAVGAEVAHLLVGDHADRLRRVLDGKVEIGGAVADALGALGHHHHLAQVLDVGG